MKKNLHQSILLVALNVTLLSAPAMADAPKSFLDYFKSPDIANPLLKNSSGEFFIQVSTTFSTRASGESAVQTVAAPTYTDIFRQQIRPGAKVPTLKSIQEKYAAAVKGYDKLSLTQRASALSAYIKMVNRVTIPSESILADLTIEQIKTYPGQIDQISKQVRDHLSLGQKIQIVSHFGTLFAGDYNNNRVGGGPGYVTLESLVSALASAENGGVCRDIALAQGQLLRSLGVPADNIFTMAYQTPSAHHAVLAIQDPETKQIIKMSYGTVSTSIKAGSAGLYIDGKHQVSGIQYKFYDVNGKPVQTQNTALGRLLNDMTGGKPVFGDDLAPYTVSKVMMSTRWGEAAVFTGQLADSNDKVTGVAFNSIDISSVLGPNTEVGVAIIDRNAAHPTHSFDQQGLFINLRTKREKEFSIGPVRATAQVGADSQFAALYTSYSVRGQRTSGLQTEYHANVFTALNLNYENYEAGVLAVGYMDFKHIAKGASGGYQLATNHVRFHVGSSKMVRGDIQVTGKAYLTVRDVGNTLNFESTAGNQKNVIGLNYQKPLSQIPYMFDGSTEVIRLKGQHNRVSANGKRSSTQMVDLRFDKDQDEAQAGFQLYWKW